MDLLPFGPLGRFARRRTLPPDIDLGDWTQVARWFDRLEQGCSQCASPADLSSWLIAWGELSAALDEEQSRRYVAMTCHTDNPEAERAYLEFVEQIEGRAKSRHAQLERLYLAHPQRARLPPGRYTVFDRDTQNRVELFREENVPLETEEARLGQQFAKLSGSLTVPFRGEEKTLVQMSRYLEETDRSLREEAWRRVAERRLSEAGNFDRIFDQLVVAREQMARNAGQASYRDYAFRKLGRFDYTPADCLRFHDSIDAEVMPLVRRLQRERRQRLGLVSLRPWDLAVDPLGRPPLRPFERVEQLVQRAQRVFARLDPELARGFRRLQELRLLDLENRKGKAPGGYLQPLAESREAFIFMNAIGVQRDVETIMHEAGHAFHALATAGEDFYPYRGGPIEFCEVASMSMELLANEFIEEFYRGREAARARRVHLEGILAFFPWMAAVDAFQHWVYTHPGHTGGERQVAWLRVMDRFDGDVDWSGLESERARHWHRQLHLFVHPFYYVEYGIAQLGALQVWANYRRNARQALSAFKAGLSRGASRTLPELFAEAGCRFEFSRDTLAPLVGLLSEEIERLGDG